MRRNGRQNLDLVYVYAQRLPTYRNRKINPAVQDVVNYIAAYGKLLIDYGKTSLVDYYRWFGWAPDVCLTHSTNILEIE